MHAKLRFLAPLTVLPLFPFSAAADTPLGWIGNQNSSAYTVDAGSLELYLAGNAVNDTLDFFNLRDDLLANTSTLEGNSGDLSATGFGLSYGIRRGLEFYFEQSSQSLSIDLGTINSINKIDIDKSLDTKRQTVGFKWTFFEANLLNPDNRRTSASLDVSASKNSSSSFDLVLDEIRLPNLTIFFRDPQTFSVADLEDSSWQARFIYSWPLADTVTGSVWLGYGESEATSSTTSDLTSATLKKFFEQRFEIDEEYVYFGAGINLQFLPRLPISIDYEYIAVNSSTFKRFPEEAPSGLPGFLSAGGEQTEDANHSFRARASYWITPSLNLSLTGNIYSNQFLGVIPHYNNPLSASFSSVLYGFAGLEIGYKF